jgi:uncharacterized protein (TIGR03083 family)
MTPTRKEIGQPGWGTRFPTTPGPARRSTPSLAAAYEDSHRAIVTLIDSLDNRHLAMMIPACPAWTTRDLIAHMSGVAADTVEGRFPPIDPHGTWIKRQAVVDGHTASQVTNRQGMAMEEIIAEWASYLPRLLSMLRGDEPLPEGSMPAHDWVIVSDIGAHNQDLRGALGVPGDRKSSAVALGLRRYVNGLSQRIDAAGLPPLRLCSEECEYIAGSGSPSVSVAANRWELFRALGSRRSVFQLRALAWSGDPEPYLALLSAYGPRADDLIE